MFCIKGLTKICKKKKKKKKSTGHLFALYATVELPFACFLPSGMIICVCLPIDTQTNPLGRLDRKYQADYQLHLSTMPSTFAVVIYILWVMSFTAAVPNFFAKTRRPQTIILLTQLVLA